MKRGLCLLIVTVISLFAITTALCDDLNFIKGDDFVIYQISDTTIVPGVFSELTEGQIQYLPISMVDSILAGEIYPYKEKVTERKIDLFRFPLRLHSDVLVTSFKYDNLIGKIVSYEQIKPAISTAWNSLFFDFFLRGIMIAGILGVTFFNRTENIEDRDNKLIVFYAGTIVAACVTTAFPGLLRDLFTSEFMHTTTSVWGVVLALFSSAIAGFYGGRLAGGKNAALVASVCLSLSLFATGIFTGLSGTYIPFVMLNITTVIIACIASRYVVDRIIEFDKGNKESFILKLTE